MRVISYLTKEHANLLVKIKYQNIKEISEVEGLSPHKIHKMWREALLCLKKAYGDEYKRGIVFDSKHAIQYMANQCTISAEEMTQRIDAYIAEYMQSDDREYWARMSATGSAPTAEEFLNDLYQYYNCDISPLPHGLPFS